MEYKRCIKKCIEKYNLSKEYAVKIATTKNSDLGVEELRYKYDNFDLGLKYPDWITPMNHLNMCYKTALKYFNSGLEKCISVDDLAYDLFLWSYIRLSKLHNFNLLKCGLHRQCCTMIRDMKLRIEYKYGELESYEDLNLDSIYAENRCCNNLEIVELITSIEKISNNKIRAILILGGYFIADISELSDLVLKVYKECSNVQQHKLLEFFKSDEYLCTKLDLVYDNKKKPNITIAKIMKVFGFLYKDRGVTEIILPYLKSIGFLNLGMEV